MAMKIKHIKAENFCGCKTLDTDLFDRTIIKGRNAVGKSTIKSVIFWVLLDKLADGTSPDGIRPHTELGVDIDYIDIVAELTCEIEGREITFKKTQKQNWAKDRTTQANVFKGNVNEFEINGIPKKKADYESYIAENIMPLDKLMLCINPFIFLNLDTKKRRAKLFEMVEDFSDTDVINTDPKFEEIRNDLLDGTIDELITRSRKVILAKKKDLEIIPARIDELDKQIKDIDTKELEEKKAICKKKIEENTSKRKDYQLVVEEANKSNVDLMQKNMDLNELVRKSNEDLVKRKRELTDKKDSYLYKIKASEKTIENFKTSIKEAESDIKASEVIIANKREEYKQIKATEFDESSTVCSFCGQELPKADVEKLVSKFETEKNAKLESITEIGNANNELIKHRKDSIKECEIFISNEEKTISELKTLIDKTEMEYDQLADEIDVYTIPGYADLEKQIKELEEAINSKSVSSVNEELENELTALNEELREIESGLSVVDVNNNIKHRISELVEEQKATAQIIASQERKLDLYVQFQKAKIDLITDKINAYFNCIEFKLFKQLINGGFEEICEPIYDGTSYDKTLNHGAKILCETDICRGFQKANNVSLPIMIDDSESVDPNLIPKMDNQVISIRRTDDDYLTIEEY